MIKKKQRDSRSEWPIVNFFTYFFCVQNYTYESHIKIMKNNMCDFFKGMWRELIKNIYKMKKKR